jgi:cytochrome c oxidase assembly protein subunit 15
MIDPTPSTPRALRRFTKFVALSALFLIYAGAMVTSTGSGLAVPDWPLSYGMLMPPMVAGIFYEHGHRLLAASVGLLTVIQAIWLYRREPEAFVRRLGWISVGAVVAQGLLGGLTVRLLLPPIVSVGHAGLAEIFLCLNVAIAFFTSEAFRRMRASRLDDAPVALTSALVVAVYLQIIAGATMRHLGAGLAIPDFPTSFGRIVPPLVSTAVAVNFAHRLGATLVALLAIAVLVRVFRSGAVQLRRAGIALVCVVAMQIWLGAKVVWEGTAANYHSLVGAAALHHASVTSFHVMTGALTLATSLIIALTARALAPIPLPAGEGGRRPGEGRVIAEVPA